MKLKKYFVIFSFLFFICHYANASHIVGGVITYECQGAGANGFVNYQITIDIYQDCLTGRPEAIAEDNPANIAIYKDDFSGYLADSIYSFSSVIVPPNFSNNCVLNPPSTCLRKTSFRKTYSLPADQTFYVVYQRCCRNQTIINIKNPGNTGATYYCVIPAKNANNCNNSAVFNNYPPQIICVNIPLVYDHSAIDADGDSLSYELCESYEGGSPGDAKPNPPSAPPFSTVNYVAGFSKLKPMVGNPLVQINPVTGLITGTPNLMGRFVVTVCCHEWRNGIIINTVKREFQFVVTNCSKAVVADIPQYSDEFNTYIVKCDSKTVKFDNNSIGGSTYYWDFGVTNLQNDTSTQFSPTYTYPDTGTYIVKLIVNKGTTCSDSISRFVKVYPYFHTNFSEKGVCPRESVSFIDSSYVNNILEPNYWFWKFGDGDSSFLQNPSHVYAVGGNYIVMLTSSNPEGCTDTVYKSVFIENFVPFAGLDTIIIKGESVYFNASGGGNYAWTPSNYLNNPFIGNPIGVYPDTGSFDYVVHIVSPYGCLGSDTVNVWVVGQGSLYIPNAFTPNGDGLNDVFKPLCVGYKSIDFFRIFSRWGEMIYTSENMRDGWDGSYHGQPCELGTYFWLIELTDRFDNKIQLKGDVTLVR